MSWGETIFLWKTIKGQKKFVASDTPIAVLSDGFRVNNLGNETSTSRYVGVFKPKTDGTCRLVWNVKNFGYGHSTNVLRMAINNVEIELVTSETKNQDIYYDFNVKAGDVFTFYIRIPDYSELEMNYIKLCANTIDSALFEYGTL